MLGFILIGPVSSMLLKDYLRVVVLLIVLLSLVDQTESSGALVMRLVFPNILSNLSRCTLRLLTKPTVSLLFSALVDLLAAFQNALSRQSLPVNSSSLKLPTCLHLHYFQQNFVHTPTVAMAVLPVLLRKHHSLQTFGPRSRVWH